MLLHIGDPQSWTTFDPVVVFAGLAAFGALGLYVWAPSVRRRAFRRRLAHLGMVVAMLVAILPSVLPYDHLVPGAVHAGTEETHAAHCHTAPGSCSDAPVSSGAGQFLLSDPLVAIPSLTTLAILLAIPILAGTSTRPTLRPPMYAS